MQQIYLENSFKGGYRKLMKYISNIAHLSQKDQEIIKKRVEIIEFFDEFGEKAARKAFHKARSTIYLWKKKLKEEGGRLSALCPESKAPKSPREKRKVNQSIEDFIIQYREKHPGVGKETIRPILDVYCQQLGLQSISESTIGRVIANLKERNLLPKSNKLSFYARSGRLVERISKNRKKLRRQGYLPKIPGDLVQIDTIEIFFLGVRRYIFTALDVSSTFAFAYTYKSKTSLNSADFLQKLLYVSPFKIKRIQTDNGSEFHDWFDRLCQKKNIIHFWNYPQHPQSNAYLERFNRTLQDQHINHNLIDLNNPNYFNQGLVNYLLWYNTEKAHKRLNKIPPLRYYVDNFLQGTKKSNMLWTLTSYCQTSFHLLEYLL